MASSRGGRGGMRVSGRAAERLADTMFALSTPSRVQILGCLLDGPHTVSELMRLTHGLGVGGRLSWVPSVA
jgi:hypothetical protein